MKSLVFCTLLITCSLVYATQRNPLLPQREILLYNGKVFTSDPSALWAEAILIRGERIAAVGNTDEVTALAAETATRIDLEGRTAIPGFNDSHTHVMWNPKYFHYIDTGELPEPGPGPEEVYALLREAAENLPPGTWILGKIGTAILDNLDVNRFTLDEVVPDHPIKLFSWAGHGTIINSLAMEEVGIDAEEPDPFGGYYDRVDDSALINGRLHEYAEWRLKGYLKNLVPLDQARQQFIDYADSVVKYGTTSIQDIPVGYTKAQAEAVLTGIDFPIRVRTICYPLEPEDSCQSTLLQYLFKGGKPSPRLTSSGIKYIADGSPIERFAEMREAYDDLPGWYGLFTFVDSLSDIVARSREGRLKEDQLIVHAVGDMAIDRILFELEVQDEGGTWTGRRTRIEHGDLLMQDQFELMKRHDVILVQNPLHFALSDVLKKRFGESRHSVMQPLRSVIEAGIPIALASDYTPGPANPFLDLMFAVTHPTNPDEAITIEQAVIAYTHGGAYAEHQEWRKGTLTPGKWADIAVLSQDIFTIEPAAFPGTTSLMTIVGGEIEYDAGVLDTQ